MDLAALYTAVNDRVTTANGQLAAGTAASGVFSGKAPAGQATPFIVYTVASCVADNTFGDDCYEVLFRLRTFIAKEGLANPLTRLSTITAQIYSTLHRWTPTLTGSWTATAIQCVEAQDEPDDDAYSLIQTFKVWIFQ